MKFILNQEGNHPFPFSVAKIVKEVAYFYNKQSLTQRLQTHILLFGYFFRLYKKKLVLKHSSQLQIQFNRHKRGLYRQKNNF